MCWRRCNILLVSSRLSFCGGLFLQSPSSQPSPVLQPHLGPPPSGHSPQRPQVVLDVLVSSTHFRLVLSPLWGPSGRACPSFWPPLLLAWHRAGCQAGLGREAELVRGRKRPGPLPSPGGKAHPPTGEQTKEAESRGLSTAHQLQPPASRQLPGRSTTGCSRPTPASPPGPWRHMLLP